MKKLFKLQALAALTASMLLSGCSDDEVVQAPVVVDEQPTGINRGVGANLTISQMDANNLHFYEMGDTIKVDYKLEVQELSAPDVAIDFYLVHNESSLAEEEEITETHLLASVSHMAVDNGSHIESFSAEIPAVEHTGDYWIVAVVDPENEIVEAHEDDNHPSVDNENHIQGDFPAIVIDIEQSPQHEFEFVKSYIDGGLVVLDAPAVHEGTGEHHSDIIGHLDAIYHGPNAATAALTAEVKINEEYQAAELWVADDATTTDVDESGYFDHQDIVFEYNGDEHFFGFDVGLTDAQLDALYDVYDPAAEINEVTIRLTLTDTTEHGAEHADDNNSVEITVPLFFYEGTEITGDEEEAEATSFAPAAMARNSNASNAKDITFTGNKLKIDGSYDKSYGDSSKFKVGVDLGGEMQIDLLDKAASLEAGGSVDMWIFNAKNTIFGASFDGQAYLAGVNTGYDAEMVIFNATVYEQSRWVAQFEKTFDKSWEEERTLVQARFNIGPVPIKVSAGVDGYVGFELTIGYALSELYANGDLFNTRFGGFARGGIDLLLVEAGVTINILILENVLAFESSAELALLEEGTVNPRVEYSFELTDDIDVISGRFGLYADVKSVKWCKAWGIPYPCGSKTTTYYLWFYQTPSVFKKSWVLYSREGSFSL